MILSFLATRWGGIVAGVLFALVALGVNNLHQQRKGAEKVVAKIEKATNDAISKANSASAKSAAGLMGLRELDYRD
jgi:hypothetical protein